MNQGGGAGEPEFSLEEILAEYRERREQGLDDRTIPLPVIPPEDLPPQQPPRHPQRNNMVRFPGARPGPTPENQATGEKADEPPTERSSKAERDEQQDTPPTPVSDLSGAAEEDAPSGAESSPPEDKPFLAARLDDLRKKADDYAEHMFEEEGVEDDEEVRRAEKYLPGVDQEEDAAPMRVRRKRPPPPPAPDLPPAELFKRYGKGLKLLKLRTIFVFLLFLPMLYITLSPALNIPLPGMLASYSMQVTTLSAMLAGAMLLGADILLRGLFRLFRLRMEMDTLVAVSCAAVLADALTLVPLGGREGQLPYCAVSVLAIGMTMWGTILKRQGQRGACRAAASAREPYLVTLDPGKWNGRDAYAKWSGEPAGFGSQIQASDGAERIFQVSAPVLLIACLLFSILSSVGQERPQLFLWSLSSTLGAAASFSATISFGMPWNTLCRRLAGTGAAIAGWDGVVSSGGGEGILLTDTDLFPPGSVALNGIKVFGNFPVEKVVAVTATLIRDSGSGLDKVFHDLLRSQGAVYRRCGDFEIAEGGLSALVRGEQILVGSASFMGLMEVPLPQGLSVKNAVFCAIDGELAGVFALNYSLHGTVRPALTSLIRNRVGPVLCTRDFNLIPAMLRQRFKLPVEKMEFPAAERRVELSDNEQEHNETLSAVLCREGMGPFSEAVVGGKRLRRAVRFSAVLASVGSAVGALLAFYLTFVESYGALSPLNLLVFLLMWLIPTLLISGWVNRY